jgi:acetyl-CoA carboxylase carboxyl transferase subunit alpha
VISPEGCVAILWKHRKHAPEAAEALKLSSPDLLQMGLVDGVIPEPAGGAHCDPAQAAENLKSAISKELQTLLKTPVEKLLRARYDKFRKMGVFEE